MSMPLLHRPLQSRPRLDMMRHEVLELCLPATSAVYLHRNDSGRQLLPARQVQRSMLVSVGDPGQHLRIGKRGLCLCDRVTADTVKHQLMPKLVSRGQLFGGGLFTDFTAS